MRRRALPPRLSQIALEARDLARGTSEEHTTTRADCIANPRVDLPAYAALDVLGAHDTIERDSVLDQHMLDMAATVGPGGSADNTAARRLTLSTNPDP